MRACDLRGQRFGKWTVVEYERVHPRGFWVCRCDCSGIGKVLAQNLTRGLSKRCQECRKLPYGEAAFNDLYGRYRRSAKRRSLSFDLTQEDAKELFRGACRYCGQSACAVWGEQLNGIFRYNGIDRLESSTGYTITNCVSCCKTCNYMKQELGMDEFLSHIRKIAKFTNTEV